MSDKYHEKVSNEELSDVVQLVGEDGDVLKFYHIGTIEYNDEWYAFFQPSDKEDSSSEWEGVDPDELVIFRLGEENGNEVLSPIKDEALLEEVYAEFMRELEEGEEFEDDEPSCDGNCKGCSGCDMGFTDEDEEV